MPETSAESLPPDQQMIFDGDIKDLATAEQQYGIRNLRRRTKSGLDPVGMMVVRDIRPLAEKVAKSLGTDGEKSWPLIKELHEKGGWEHADRLKAAQEPEIRAYLVLAAACQENEKTAEQYMSDRARIVDELSTFTPEDFERRLEDLFERTLKGKVQKEVHREIGGKGVTVPVAKGDVALPLAMKGHKGCVAIDEKRGDHSAQTAKIDDAILEESGLIPGFAEVYNENIVNPDGSNGNFERVEIEKAPGARVVWVPKEEKGNNVNEMTPVAKRIYPGYVLTYKNEELAIDLVAKAIAAQEQKEAQE